MIDVVFLLLIFFVCAAAGQTQERILPADLSGGSIESTEPTVDEDPWVTRIDLLVRNDPGTGKTVTYLNGNPWPDHADLKRQLLAIGEVTPDSPVILEIEATVPMGDAVAVLDTCKSAGFENVLFAAHETDE